VDEGAHFKTVSFHSIPRQKENGIKWIAVLQKHNGLDWVPKKDSRVCSVSSAQGLIEMSKGRYTSHVVR